MKSDRARANPGLLSTIALITMLAQASCTMPPSASEDVSEDASEKVVSSSSLHDYRNATIVESDGERVYEKNCASCHDGGVHRGPHKSMIALMSASSIYNALTQGVMSAQASHLGDPDKRRVAEYLANNRLDSTSAAIAPVMCSADASKLDVNQPPALGGWGFTPTNTHYIDPAQTSITRDNVTTLKLKWGFAFPEALRVRSRPALAGGAVFVGSHNAKVYALDQETACVRWVFAASAEVRNGIVVAPWEAGDSQAEPLVYFGDLLGNVYAVDARTGTLVWRDRPDSHPNATITGAPVLFEDTLYVPISSLEVLAAFEPDYECCTFRGSVVAYRAKTGAKQWQSFSTDKPKPHGLTANGTVRMSPSGAPVWSSPTIDAARRQIVFGTGENYSSPATATSDAIMAVDMATGDINWVYQGTADDAWNTACVKGGNSVHPTAGGADLTSGPNCPEENGPDVDFGAGAILTTTPAGRDVIVAGQKSGVVHALDAATGELIWKNKVGRGSLLGGVNFGMAIANNKVYVPIADLQDGSGETPAGVFIGKRHPGLYALDVSTGEFIWRAPMADTCAVRGSCSPGIAQAIAATDELVIAGGLDGVLRVYDSATGVVLWQYKTAKEFVGINGVQGAGGGFAGGAGPVVHGSTLYVSSGYAFNGLMPGNMLLAFELPTQ